MAESRQGWQYQVPVTQCSAGLAGARAEGWGRGEGPRGTGGPRCIWLWLCPLWAPLHRRVKCTTVVGLSLPSTGNTLWLNTVSSCPCSQESVHRDMDVSVEGR